MKQKTKLAKFLKNKRIEASLTQIQLAKTLGYSTPQFISNWERGISQPPVNNLLLLAKIFKVNQDELFELLLEMKIEEATEELKQKFFGRK